MDTESLPRDFSEVIKLPADKKEEVLAASRRAAVVELGLGLQFAINLVMSLLLAFCLSVSGLLLFDLSLMQNALFCGLGSICAIGLYHHLTTRLLKKGYEALLSQ